MNQGHNLVAAASPSVDDVFGDWDPMRAEHESIRNTYRLNPDDADVALFGYGKQVHNVAVIVLIYLHFAQQIQKADATRRAFVAFIV